MALKVQLAGPRAPPQYDWRFGALLRLVKLWARHYGINDSANGTFNSFALTLLVGQLGRAWRRRRVKHAGRSAHVVRVS